MTRVLITGVRGKTGDPLARSLAADADVEVLGGSTEAARVRLPGVRPIAFSWDDPGGWPDAVDGADAVYLVRPDRADAPALSESFLDVLPSASRVVLLSERGVGGYAGDTWAAHVEAVVRDSGRPFVVLRPSWFMQVLTDSRFFARDVAAGRLPFPSGEAEVAWIDAADIAAVAERALLDPALDAQVLELSGPRALTLGQTAAVLSDALGRPVEHVEQDVEEAVAGLDGFDRELTVVTYERLRDGGFAGVTDTVERVAGRPARDLATFAGDAASQGAWAGS